MHKIPFSKVICDGDELANVQRVLASGWLTTAGRAVEFEERFAAFVGAPHACAVNSCTAALHLAMESLGVAEGDKVLVPTWTFTATAEVVRYLGADPVFLDVDYGTTLLTPEIVAEGLKRYPDAKALMVVHFGGHPAKMVDDGGSGIVGLCRNHGVKVVEDAAHAFPTRLAGRLVGTFGDITCFSFYANKTITTGEGGMLVTADEEIWRRAKIMRLHGIDRDVWNRFTSDKPSWEYDVVAPGYKYNMPDLNAAIGLAQLDRAEEFRRERERCARFYFETLADCPDLDLPLVQIPYADHAWHLFPIILKESCSISRNDLIEQLAARGIGTSVHYKPVHRLSYYAHRYGLRAEEYPNAERLWRGCISLPIYPSLTDDELKCVSSTVRELLVKPRESVNGVSLSNEQAHQGSIAVTNLGSNASTLTAPRSGNRIRLSIPHASGHEARYIEAAFASNWLSTAGPNIEALEQRFSAMMGRSAVAVSCGTSAMHLGLRVLGVSAGDEVVVPSLTFVASCNPILYLGGRPVFIDSERTSWNLDPNLLAQFLRKRAAIGQLPKVVIVVHLFGQSADLDPILNLCQQYQVHVLEDAAESLGALYKGRQTGTFGDVGVFSFNGNKIITGTSG
ncbi:MAG: DegT/DnrJ/EryC1/StrS family aminotransferase, partial [Limisphaerales bacterium]